MNFNLGDKVAIRTLFDANNEFVRGIIVGHYYEDGDFWVVRTNGGNLHDCWEEELVPS